MPRKKKQDSFFDEVDQKFAFLIVDFGITVADRHYAAAFEGLCIVWFSGPVKIRIVRDRGYSMRVDFTASECEWNDIEWHDLVSVVDCIENKVCFLDRSHSPDLTELATLTERYLPRIIDFFANNGESRLNEFWESHRDEYISTLNPKLTKFDDESYGYSEGVNPTTDSDSE